MPAIDFRSLFDNDAEMSANQALIQVTTTCATRDDALRIARALVDERLAACVQTSGPITSVYRWQGRIETGEEWCCTAKTLRSLYPRVAARIREMHTYEEPEIVAILVAEVSDGYRRWLHDQVDSTAEG